MKIGKKYRGILGAFAAVAAAAGLWFDSTYAATAVDSSASCSLTLTTAKADAFADDLAALEGIHVNLYKVADVEKTGAYVSVDAFADLKIEELKGDDGKQWASAWAGMAEKAAGMLDGMAPDTEITMTHDETLGVCRGTAAGLAPGLYLVMADTADSAVYEYTFSPYLVALPDNLYYESGNPADDQRLYDVTAGLKARRQRRLGRLAVRKTLEEYNTILGDATFVFQIEGADENGRTVYSNVVSTNHRAAGTAEAVCENIPVGITVTVTEVHSGASYTATSDTEQTAVIVADEMPGAPAAVNFTNTYNEKLVPGAAVINHFSYGEDGKWSWKQQGSGSDEKE